MEILEFIELQKRAAALYEKVKLSQRGEQVEILPDEMSAFEALGGVSISKDVANPYEYARLEIHKREAAERNPEKDFSKCKNIAEVVELEYRK